MTYVILDLEWNTGYCKKTDSYFNEIIEFGALKLNDKLEVLESFSTFVQPLITRRLNSAVKRLTGLTEPQLREGLPFTKALSMFRGFLGDSVLMSWSTSDLSVLEKNCDHYFGRPQIPSVKRYADLQQYCQDMLLMNGQNPLSLSSAAKLLSVDYGMKQSHRALDDCILALSCLRELYLPSAMVCYISNVDEAFYAALNGQNGNHISLEEVKHIVRSVHFTCPVCGRRCVRRGGWELKNKGFTAQFFCRECSQGFTGRASVKQKGELITVKKHIVSEDTEPEQNE